MWIGGASWGEPYSNTPRTRLPLFCQRLPETAGLARPDKALALPPLPPRLAGGDRATDGRIVNGRHRAAEIGGIAHRRQTQLHRPSAARRNDAVEAQPQRHPVAREGELHGPPGQRLGLAVEEELRSLRRLVARTGRPALRIARAALPEPSLGIAGPALQETPLRVPVLLFLQ